MESENELDYSTCSREDVGIEGVTRIITSSRACNINDAPSKYLSFLPIWPLNSDLFDQ